MSSSQTSEESAVSGDSKGEETGLAYETISVA